MKKGEKMSQEQKDKISASKKGIPLSPEALAKQTATMQRPEVRAKISASIKRLWEEDPSYRARVPQLRLGTKHSKETRAKMSKAHMGNTYSLGTRHTDEWKALMSEKMKGRDITWGDKISKALVGRKLSPEHVEKMKGEKPPEVRAKISATLKGRKPTAQAIANMSKAQKGLKVSAEGRAKMSAAQRRPEVIRKRHETWAANGNMSCGEKKMQELLLSMSIPFIPGHQFDLGYKHWAIADAYVLGPKELVLEYDGHGFHYAPEGIVRDNKRDKDMMKLHGLETVRIERKEVFTKNAPTRIARAIGAI